jgi:hypothetical protein
MVDMCAKQEVLNVDNAELENFADITTLSILSKEIDDMGTYGYFARKECHK